MDMNYCKYAASAAVLINLLLPCPAARAQADAFRDADSVQASADRADQVYERGIQARDQKQWQRAIQNFDEAIRLKGDRADGALYWKAYSQNKLGARTEALQTLETLRKAYPESRWLADAKALDFEVRQASGQPVAPEQEADEDLKLMALNSLQNSEPERAVPILEKIVQGNQSSKIKERALFILAQSDSPRATEVLARIGRGNANPDLQLKALNYLGVEGGRANLQLLSDIYSSSNDNNAKRAILHSYMVAGDKAHLLAAAKNEKNLDLKKEAIHQLGVLDAADELWDLYQKEPSTDLKETILHGLFIGDNVDRIIEVARNDKDDKLRLAAIHWLGVMDGHKTADTLVSIYEGTRDAAVRQQVIQGLFVQDNAKALVSLARKEADLSIKKSIVNKLSLMDSDEARKYLMEILNK
jgi:hypothetical protein